MNPTPFEQNAQHIAQWITDLLAYHVADGNMLAAMRGLSAITLAIAWHASRGRHWTGRVGLMLLLVLLALDAIVGIAPGRLQYLTPAFIGRNIAIPLIAFFIARRPRERVETLADSIPRVRSRARNVHVYEERGEIR